MAASQGYRSMLEQEWKPEYKHPYTNLVVVDYDTHPRYSRGTVLTRTGTPIEITGDKWRNRTVGHPSSDEIHAEITEHPIDGLTVDPPPGLPEPKVIRYFAYDSDGNGGWLPRTSFLDLQVSKDMYQDLINQGKLRIAVEKSVVEWVE